MANDLMNRHNDLMDFGAGRFFNRLAHSFFDDDFSDLTFNDTMRTDIKESDQAYTATIDLPGVDKKDLKIDYQNNILTVSAKNEQNTDERDENDQLVHRERRYGQFSRQYQLPNVDQDKITAKYNDGVLTITLPKSAEATKHQIEIQ
ncbi:Hsp20/alpha crystallin family protein [Loigolactobacillus coryniformis]|jgi:HSP20 family protein|uniref:Heat-shock protein Hsp20 n=1 Tax=Loigolactobacillus coryniformis subsp. torquens DSM 20004 = KCTC 3535 TaxID=1423822 RepID=A0A2D1KL22_9LACO|nr:Hsp20/alpha crystallin family protein [Loigolactobacillus coryniformis]ATO42781.1 heat-shock protein Hsp20 [Loigolactobacillus coryniformis subsp. torquens DSM 20004 = KCTC 3535]KRK75691.1 heat shock protein Hsp20 [Loigolactobacillus coryniformis subsp. torquens DSM 20004 = KCTC 3535]